MHMLGLVEFPSTTSNIFVREEFSSRKISPGFLVTSITMCVTDMY